MRKHMLVIILFNVFIVGDALFFRASSCWESMRHSWTGVIPGSGFYAVAKCGWKKD